MADRTIELQAGIYAALIADATLTGLLGQDANGDEKVYDTPLPQVPAPYVVIGESVSTDAGAQAIDGQYHALTIHVWTEEPSTLGNRKMQAAIRAALHEQEPALSAGTCVFLRCESQETLHDPDGVSKHGILRFRALTN